MKRYLMLITLSLLCCSSAYGNMVTASDSCASISLSGPDSDPGATYLINATGRNFMGGVYTASFYVDGQLNSTVSSPVPSFYKPYGPFQGGHVFKLVFETKSCNRSVELVVKSMDPKQMAADVCSSISALPNNAFSNNPSQRKKTFCSKIDEVVGLISSAESSTGSTEKTEYYQNAIDKLQNDIGAKMDSHAGGQPNNDWIVDESSQKPIYETVVSIVNILKTLK